MQPPPVRSLFDFSGKVVLVTGASGGIGAGIASRFAEAGAKIAVHFRSDKAGADTVIDDIEGQGGSTKTFQANLANETETKAMFNEIIHYFGQLDIVVNNAGAFPNSTISDMSLDDWKSMYAANTESVFLCTREAAARMQQGGSIINIASIAASNAGPDHAHYNSAKAAVVMFTQSAAQEFGPHNIRVNAISPGVIGRDNIRHVWPDGVARWEAKAPLGRLGTPTDVANACLFFASPAANFVTGANLPVDGGVLSAPIY